MAENLVKANIQGVDMHLVKINNIGLKANRASLGRILKGGGYASSTNPEKGRAGKCKLKDSVRPSDVTNGDKKMHNCMDPDRPCLGL